MKKTIIIGMVALMAAAWTPASAQMFYHTTRTPQSNLLNPAFFPSNNTFYLTLPGVDMLFSGPLMMGDVIHYDQTRGATVIDLNNIVNTMGDKNKLRMSADVDIFGFGFQVKKLFFTFNTRLVNQVSLGISKSTIDALMTGNITATGEARPVVEVMNGDMVNVNSYLEAGLGAGYFIEPWNLTVGVKAKLLFGVANIQSDNTKIELLTDPNQDSVTARMFYEIQSATFAPYDTVAKKFQINMGDILSHANTGVAFDLGAKYDWGPFSFSASINDLSAGIHWKNNVSTWRPEGGQGYIDFHGMNINGMLNNGTFSSDSIANYLQERLDSMKPYKTDSGDYWFSIPTKFNVGASYSFAKLFKAGLLFHGQLDRGLLCKTNDIRSEAKEGITNTFRFNTTLTLGVNLYNWMEAIVGSSIVYDGNKASFFNPGMGLVLTPGTVFQLYIMTDYMSSFYLTDSKTLSMRFGINLLFGKGNRTSVTVYED